MYLKSLHIYKHELEDFFVSVSDNAPKLCLTTTWDGTALVKKKKLLFSFFALYIIIKLNSLHIFI